MKKILTLISFLFNIVFALAQTTNYYAVTKTFNEQGYTYQCDVSGGRYVTLYNKNNKWTYVDQMKKGTNTPFYVTPENYSPISLGIAIGWRISHIAVSGLIKITGSSERTEPISFMWFA